MSLSIRIPRYAFSVSQAHNNTNLDYTGNVMLFGSSILKVKSYCTELHDAVNVCSLDIIMLH
jgi:hypothetical protein